MKSEILFLTLLSVSGLPSLALADCADDIRAMYERRGDIAKVSYTSVTEVGGSVVQEHRGWHQDYRHNMSELVGRNMWFMVYGDTSWDSSDGKNWKKADFQDPDWEKKSREQRLDMLTNMTDVECPGGETLDGRAVEVYRYTYKTDFPFSSHSQTTVFYDRENNFVFRTIHRMLDGSDTIITHTYTQDETIVIPDPEG